MALKSLVDEIVFAGPLSNGIWMRGTAGRVTILHVRYVDTKPIYMILLLSLIGASVILDLYFGIGESLPMNLWQILKKD